MPRVTGLPPPCFAATMAEIVTIFPVELVPSRALDRSEFQAVTDLDVRLARPEDLAPSIDVLIGVSEEPGSLVGRVERSRRDSLVEELHRWLAEGTNAIFVATLDGDVVGSLHVIVEDGMGEVRMNVRADQRGRGGGTRLLAAADDWARSRGLRRLWLKVLAPNTRAIALYERAGFAREGLLRQHTRDRVTGEIFDTVYMGKLF